MIWLKRILDKSVPLSDYTSDASDWRRCAISEARDASLSDVVVSLRDHDDPHDRELARLGREFPRAVQKNRRAAALRIYLAIQKRLARLARVGR